ncbi:putative bifunctional diguanylate cyclase/phosphodiesterase [Alicycliphilus denitrificans]|uniref:putative bifunctional diguanylate cyclase/phosphodiesterase n=1 Tax=Alicycliphilus denitrificans TaxID=179636 RepID=UPI00384A5335
MPSPSSDPSGLDSCTGDALLRLLADAVPLMLAYYDAQHLRCTFANQRFADFVGRTVDSLPGTQASDALDAQTWRQIQPLVQRALKGEAVQHTCQRLDPERVLEFTLQPHHAMPGGQPATVGLIMLINDVSHHWQAQHAARQSEERMRKFAEATEEGLVFHQDGLILDANEPMLRLTGYTLAEVVGRSIFDFIPSEYRALAEEYTRRAREYPYELTMRHKSGRLIPIEAVGKTMTQPQGEHRVVVVRDITARRQAQERARFLALHDTLTQLPNRRHLMQQLARWAASARQRHARMALLFIDLDHFKTVNESLGHEAGDQLLCEMARRLQDGVSATDFVARVGGDQFVVLLPDLPHRGAAGEVADALARRMSAAYVIGDTPLSLSLSVGISILPGDGYDPDDLLRRAAAAMRQAKESGRGTRLFYTGDMAGQPAETLQQEHLLREAMAQQALRLHYQPQVHAASGRLAGFEALVRWQHPLRGLIGPDEFIPLAESRGLITPISRWVLREACRQLKAWHDEGLPRVPVAVNLSAIEFRQRDVVREIAQVLTETGLPPEYLEIEITETTLMQQAEHTHTTLQELQALGVAVTVDDFGTGYSSLAYLKRYPLDKIKVDRSFVIDTPGDADDVAIVTAIIELARSLQLQSVAEGVETPEQLALLRRLGCELAQGYGIAPPMDAQRTRAWLQALAPA